MTLKSLDMFMTRAEEDISKRYGNDDAFCAAVQSIFISPNDPDTAFITEEDTNWLIPLWTWEYDTKEAETSAYHSLKKGDVIRVGAEETEGFTTYIPVIEVRHVKYLAASTTTNPQISKENDFTLKSHSATSDAGLYTTSTEAESAITIKDGTRATWESNPKGYFSRYTFDGSGIAHICIRLGQSFNCTSLDQKSNRSFKYVDYARAYMINPDLTYAGTGIVTLETRNNAHTYVQKARTAYTGEQGRASENYYFPMYLSRPWTSTPLVTKFDGIIKKVHRISLVGYTFVNKKQVGIQSGHEMLQDDYLILNIQEMQGHVMSNNKHAENAFAILQTGHDVNTTTGGTEFSMYDPAGIVTLDLPDPGLAIKQMTAQLTDREGKVAQFGRCHLWFKVLVTSG